jgi:mycothiol synthase
MSARQVPVARPFIGDADIEKTITLLQAEADVDREGLTVSEEDLRFEWVDDEPGWVRNLQVWEVGDELVACFGAWHETADELNRAYGEIHTHPDWREPDFIDEIARASVQAVAELIDRPVEFRIGGAGSQDWKHGGLERAGFTVDRYFFRMSANVDRTLPEPVIPEGFAIRPLAGEAEIEKWVETFNAAFADHHDPPTTTIEEKRRRLTEAGYLPKADLVAVDGAGRLAGVGRNSIEKLADGGEKPWVNSIALRPEARGRGLGRALLLASMTALRDAGHQRVHLSLDSDNQSGALQLYESVGFRVDSRMIVYMRVVEPAVVRA